MSITTKDELAKQAAEPTGLDQSRPRQTLDAIRLTPRFNPGADDILTTQS
jgi:hypothetical protein